MSERRPRTDHPVLPGMASGLARTPPKANEYRALTLDQAIERAHEILDQVLASAVPDHTITLFSGGGDSSILAHLFRQRVNAFGHTDTGIGIPACRSYVEAVAEAWRVPLLVTKTPESYRDLVLGRVKAKTKDRAVWKGFPGPAGHRVMFARLKERALDQLRRDLVGPRGRAGQLVWLSGMRWAESQRRFLTASESSRWGAVTWCSPLVWWTNEHMMEYRDRHLCRRNHEHAPHMLCRSDALPMSEVTIHLHMSGDCLCGSYAREGELGEIEFFYPDVAERIRSIEAEARAAGLLRCQWGVKVPGQLDAEPCVDPVGGDPVLEVMACASCIPTTLLDLLETPA
jgi:3'-phosphoadenosine 5'-phosphosulfate sulfotransferase (PAPS reductase)/FAD synthetase